MDLFRSRADAIAFLLGRINFEHEPTVPYHESHFRLARMRRLCEELGQPQQQVPLVHIAGSKGKGSTTAMIAAGLRQSGYRVGSYTSPHVAAIEERISLNGASISEDAFVGLLNQMLPTILKLDHETTCSPDVELRPTFFEITTAMAFLAFAQAKLDIAVVEVGLGGRLDSTNVCHPVCTVITTISRDHMAQLGDTIPQIASEKAGIIKDEIPLICGVTDAEAIPVIERQAREKNSPIQLMGRDFGYVSQSAKEAACFHHRLSMFYWDRYEQPISELRPRMLGRHQHGNAAIAIAVLRELRRRGWKLTDAAIQQGVESASCRARIELLQQSPTVILDTAHNGASMQALADTIETYWPQGTNHRRIVVLATTRGKDQDEIAAAIVRIFDRVIATKYQDNPRGEPIESLAAVLQRHARQANRTPLCEISTELTPQLAIRRAASMLKEHDILCITGSFFLAGESLPHLELIVKAAT